MEASELVSPAELIVTPTELSSQNVCWTNSDTFQLDRTANQRVIAATILSYVQVNAEAIRKLGKKYDKCMILSVGTSDIENNGKDRKYEEKIVQELNIRLRPIIKDLNSINKTLQKKGTFDCKAARRQW